jgi:NO-binding membrane sensor protein with MHYT domain
MTSGKVRLLWLVGGAIAMGTGIWSMHFVAMLAFHLSQSINYEVSTTLFSWFYAIVASGIALWLPSHQNFNVPLLLIGGTCMGIAIAWMHYTGMAAMRLQAQIEYDFRFVALSVAIAIGASITALWLAFRLQNNNLFILNWRKISSALVMGVAISGMHYTGMAATHFIPQKTLPSVAAPEINPSLLAVIIGIATIFLLSITLLGSLFDQRLTFQLVREAALQESEQRFRLLIQEMQVGVLLINAQGEIVIANKAAETLLGLPKERLENSVFGSKCQFWQEDNTLLSHSELPVQQAIAQKKPMKIFCCFTILVAKD